MVYSYSPPPMGDPNTPSAGGADIEPQEAMYDVPSAGGDVVPGGYGAPTPHAAAVSEDPYVAPEGDPEAMDDGWAMTQGNHVWTSTPNESVEPSPNVPSAWTDIS